jgi:hypothetical protein
MSRPARATHGDYGYARKHRCQCLPCLTAQRRYAKGLNFDHARGVARRIDAAPVRAHLQWLLDGGARRHEIARAAGLADSVLKNILVGKPGKGPAEYVLRPTAEKILALNHVDGLMSAVGLRRRIEALEYLGHTKAQIGEAMGVTESWIFELLKLERVKATTVHALDEVYRQMSLSAGSSERIRWRAYRRGFVGPMCWDEDTIDDPTAEPAGAMCVANCSRPVHASNLCETHYVAVRRMGGLRQARYFRPTVLRLRERQVQDPGRLRSDIAELKALGYSPQRAAARLNRSFYYVEKVWNTA